MNCISNPPYNLKWEIPPLAKEQNRFKDFGVPPKSNANYAFVLSAIEECEKGSFILPNNILTSSLNEEKNIRETLIKKNYVEAIILCPDKMFEATSISVCVLCINKNKDTYKVVFVDMRKTYQVEKREQNGQFGGKSHTNRTYVKEVKVFSDEQIEKCIKAIRDKSDINEFSKTVTIKEIERNNFDLTPSKYIDFIEKECKHRPYEDIVNDLNKVIDEKNILKITVNENIAKNIFGFDVELYKNEQNDNIILPKSLNLTVHQEKYISFTKNKNEIKFENASKEELSIILRQMMMIWKTHIQYLNEKQNLYLAELRDALLPDLLSGKLEID